MNIFKIRRIFKYNCVDLSLVARGEYKLSERGFKLKIL